jgi:hypothetical protein
MFAVLIPHEKYKKSFRSHCQMLQPQQGDKPLRSGGTFQMIIKAKSFGNFAIVSNSLARDKTITNKAKGLFLLLASLPSDWVIYKSQLHEFSCDGRRSVMKAFDELIAARYIYAVKKIHKNGRFNGWEYIVYPEKQSAPFAKNAITDNAIAENSKLIKKEETNKELTNKEKHTQSASSFFSNEGNQPAKQKTKQPSRENGKPKATDTIDVRKKKFWAEIVVASRTVSTTQESAEAFNDHYTSTDINNPNLMRFEDDRFWNTEKKLKKWMKLEKPDYKDWDND